MVRAIVYLHGFNSGSASVKGRELEAAVAALADPPLLYRPQLHHRPQLAMAAIEAWLAQVRPARFSVVGSSLGGFYATWLAERHDAHAVVINPAVRPCRDLAAYRGPQHNPYTGEDYTLTDAHVAELAALRVDRITRAERYFLLVQTGDEVLDWREAVAFYAGGRQSVQGGGDHAFADFASQLPAILRFVDA